MKAIVNVKKQSVYSKHNGLTFEIKHIKNGFVCLLINDVETDFGYNEVMIVDFTKEIQEKYEDRLWYGFSESFNGLRNYAVINEIKYELKEKVWS
jgi:hypothetical protein